MVSSEIAEFLFARCGANVDGVHRRHCRKENNTILPLMVVFTKPTPPHRSLSFSFSLSLCRHSQVEHRKQMCVDKIYAVLSAHTFSLVPLVSHTGMLLILNLNTKGAIACIIQHTDIHSYYYFGSSQHHLSLGAFLSLTDTHQQLAVSADSFLINKTIVLFA